MEIKVLLVDQVGMDHGEAEEVKVPKELLGCKVTMVDEGEREIVDQVDQLEYLE